MARSTTRSAVHGRRVREIQRLISSGRASSWLPLRTVEKACEAAGVE
jgi:hypothetical protein